MKKSTLLSLLTTAAIVTTTAGTYAAWDKLEANTTSNAISFRKPINLNINDNKSQTVSNSVLTDPSATYSVSFTIENNENSVAKQLQITPTIIGSDIDPDDFNIEIIDKSKSQDAKLSEDPKKSGSFIDDSLGSLDYDVKVTPTNIDDAEKDIQIKLYAILQ